MRIYYNLTVWHATSFKLGPRREEVKSSADRPFVDLDRGFPEVL